MQKLKTQQFAKFFLKDLKTEKPEYINEKYRADKFNSSSSN